MPKRKPLPVPPEEMNDAIYMMKVITGEIEVEPDEVYENLTVKEFLDMARSRSRVSGGPTGKKAKKAKLMMGSGLPLPDCDCDMEEGK